MPRLPDRCESSRPYNFVLGFGVPAALMLALLIGGFAIVIWLGGALAPFFTALVVAFLLQGVVAWLERRGLPRLLAVGLVFLLFVGALLALALVIMPLVWNQLVGRVLEHLGRRLEPVHLRPNALVCLR